MRASNVLRRSCIALGVCVGFLFFAQTVCLAREHTAQKPAKQAILLVTFGTSVPEAQKSFDLIDARVKKEFPGVEVRWAYTSKIIRHKLAKEGIQWQSPAEALAKLMDDGFNRVAVQSLHVIPGREYTDLVDVVKGFGSIPDGFDKILVGYPLCATTDDLQTVAKALLNDLPKERKQNEAVCFMGHGTAHPAGVVYPAMAYILQKSDPLAILGTVEGYPTLEDVKAELLRAKVKKAYLIPFMTVAGDHAMNDMAGDEPDSWKSTLTKAGIECVPVMKAVTESPAIIDVWMAHLKTVIGHMGQ